ncbi:hypothetical protein ACWFR1_38400 [Streptomyces sp. NPDC055103]
MTGTAVLDPRDARARARSGTAGPTAGGEMYVTDIRDDRYRVSV